jgi:hypothetical protein
MRDVMPTKPTPRPTFESFAHAAADSAKAWTEWAILPGRSDEMAFAAQRIARHHLECATIFDWMAEREPSFFNAPPHVSLGRHP